MACMSEKEVPARTSVASKGRRCDGIESEAAHCAAISQIQFPQLAQLPKVHASGITNTPPRALERQRAYTRMRRTHQIHHLPVPTKAVDARKPELPQVATYNKQLAHGAVPEPLQARLVTKSNSNTRTCAVAQAETSGSSRVSPRRSERAPAGGAVARAAHRREARRRAAPAA